MWRQVSLLDDHLLVSFLLVISLLLTEVYTDIVLVGILDDDLDGHDGIATIVLLGLELLTAHLTLLVHLAAYRA